MADLALDTSKFVTYDGSPFQLYQPFAPAGDQPDAIARLIAGIEDGLSFQTLLGVTGSGKTYTMANVIAKMGRPALVVVVHPHAQIDLVGARVGSELLGQAEDGVACGKRDGGECRAGHGLC